MVSNRDVLLALLLMLAWTVFVGWVSYTVGYAEGGYAAENWIPLPNGEVLVP